MVNDCCRNWPEVATGRKYLVNLFLALATTCGRDFASAHQVANVFLQELVVVIKLVVLFANGFYTVENGEERVL